MKYISTRNNVEPVSVSQAILNGIAPDGGLYVPETFPEFSLKDFDGAKSLSEIADILLSKFFNGDDLAQRLLPICQSAFDFEVPLRQVTDGLQVLELFHGPTAAFKDFGARFLSKCIGQIPISHKKTILVATSGDTGGAVGCAFEQNPGAKVVILFPKGRVSPLQQQQLTCWGKNVQALEVNGDFDDCQRLVKQAFADKEMCLRHNLSSANSINIARLLPQMSYYAASSLTYFRRHKKPANFIIPTGNMGNGMAALWARICGLPIGRIHFSCNDNQTLFEFFVDGKFKPRHSIATIANAMDVGNPSNFERFAALAPDQTRHIDCKSFTDQQIRDTIKTDYHEFGQIWCPHTACAAQSWRELPSNLAKEDWLIVATAHPYKFSEVIEPIIDTAIAPPDCLAQIMERQTKSTPLEPELPALADILSAQTF